MGRADNLRKVDDDLYLEDIDGCDKPFRWERQFEVVSLKLKNVKLEDIITLDIPKIDRFAEKIQLNNIVVVSGLASLNGDFTPIGQDKSFREVYFSLRAENGPAWEAVTTEFLSEAARDERQVHYFGSFWHSNGDDWFEEADGPYIFIQVSLPLEAVEAIAKRIRESVPESLDIEAHVRIPVFRSEVDRALEEPYHYKSYFIEAEKHAPAALANFTLSPPSIRHNHEGERHEDEVPELSPISVSSPTPAVSLRWVYVLLTLILVAILIKF